MCVALRVQLLLYHGEDLTSLNLASPDSQREGYHIVQLLPNRVADASAEDVIRNSLLFLPY